MPLSRRDLNYLCQTPHNVEAIDLGRSKLAHDINEEDLERLLTRCRSMIRIDMNTDKLFPSIAKKFPLVFIRTACGVNGRAYETTAERSERLPNVAYEFRHF